MGRPRKVERVEATALKLQRTALDHFARMGLERASLSDIARDVGVTRTTLLYHFETKEKLYNAVVQAAFTRLASELVESMGASGTLRERVGRMIRGFLAFVEANPSLAKLMIREVIDERGPGCTLIVDRGLPVLELVEEFFVRDGRLLAAQRGMLREILLQITTSIMLKSASGAMRETFWGGEAHTGELASLLLEGLLGLSL